MRGHAEKRLLLMTGTSPLATSGCIPLCPGPDRPSPRGAGLHGFVSWTILGTNPSRNSSRITEVMYRRLDWSSCAVLAWYFVDFQRAKCSSRSPVPAARLSDVIQKGPKSILTRISSATSLVLSLRGVDDSFSSFSFAVLCI